MGGNDLLEGESGGDDLDGGTEADVLRGGDQADRLTGGSEDDVLDGGTDADTLIGAGGTDTITYAGSRGAVAVTLDGVRNDGADPNSDGVSSVAEEHDLDRTVENAIGGDAGDILRAPLADGVVNVLRGVLGNDTLNAREGTGTVDRPALRPWGRRLRKDPADLQVGCRPRCPEADSGVAIALGGFAAAAAAELVVGVPKRDAPRPLGSVVECCRRSA